MSDTSDTDTTHSIEPRRWSATLDAKFDAKRRELGVDDRLKDIPGVNTLMLVALGESGIRSVEDLADCATDDLNGWSECKGGKNIKHTGILDGVGVSRKQCESITINARMKAGWIKEPA